MNEMKTELSPAVQAVLDAYMTGYGWLDGPCHEDCLGVAAALRAAADQMSCYQSKKFLYSIADAMKLFAIATELEGQL
jgi:hypothetical protein